ncbi:MAG: hypothetical protein A2Y62_12685 [Candidatus Fischerbacteria bacterium RBG_13_37_8]|uniref:HEAT repeat domain-containing protein n=1 Tax=Candidatus Fischerbacteria bacterium RBG_13_37_8 TaxID=1817863 RepID=A0A1F5VR88_9BACT|nr:MAG: hypothetical protein A2Y62_12685 [Candidatus Fischerbacteria bacterium RBG_13_37_8]
MQDRTSLPLLIVYLNKEDLFTRALIIETIGQLGGPEARKVLRDLIVTLEPRAAGFVYKAFAHCAIKEDIPVFQEAVHHSDWVVRLACTEVLGKFPEPENIAILAGLVADTVDIISKRASEYLESR